MSDTLDTTTEIADLRRLYRLLALIRRFEERSGQARQQGHVPGVVHPCIGQEAVAVGVCDSLRDDDVITSTHRGHGHLLARGARPELMFAELFARESGYNRGRGGSVHITDASLGFLGANGIVGGGIPLATGAALELRRRGEGAVAVCFFGDGAVNVGAFHESLNMAALWSLPVVYVCENNLYSEFSASSAQSAVDSVVRRADANGVPGRAIDGNDVVAVRAAAFQAVDRARAGDGPSLIEARTYRHRGHYEGDMARYRPEGELEHWLARDPIMRVEQRLAELGATSVVELVHHDVESEIDDAVVWALAQSRPRPEAAQEHVYVDSIDGQALA